MEDLRLYKRLDSLEQTVYALSSQVDQQKELIKLLQEKIKRLESAVFEDGAQK